MNRAADPVTSQLANDGEAALAYFALHRAAYFENAESITGDQHSFVKGTLGAVEQLLFFL